MKNILIIDDETSARLVLRNFIGTLFPDYNILGEASNINDAVNAINTLKPNLIFLDIQLDMGTGFNILESIENRDFSVIFVTAFENYAIEAFKFSAIDYILKPVKIADLKKAIEKYENKHTHPIDNQQIAIFNDAVSKQVKDKIVLPTTSGFEVVKIQEIVRLESDRNYTNIILTSKKKILVSKTIKIYQELLEDVGFMRVHQSHLINLNFVKQYIRGQGGEIVMSDDSYIPLSRKMKDSFLSVFTG